MLSGQGYRTDFAATSLRRNNGAEQEQTSKTACAEKIPSAAQGVVGRRSGAQIDGFVLPLTLWTPLSSCRVRRIKQRRSCSESTLKRHAQLAGFLPGNEVGWFHGGVSTARRISESGVPE
jgi:hypothetical protein